MALLAHDAQDRAEQLLLLTERLTALVAEETRRIESREPPLQGAEGDEKNRLANAYRLELARIKQDRSLIDGAAATTLAVLKQRTVELHETLANHEIALNAVKTVTEGLVQAIAEEVARQRGAPGYGAAGCPVQPAAPSSGLFDRSA